MMGVTLIGDIKVELTEMMDTATDTVKIEDRDSILTETCMIVKVGC